MIQLDLEAKGVSQGLLTFTAGVRAKEWRHFRSLFFSCTRPIIFHHHYLMGWGQVFFYLAQFSTLLGFRRCKMKVKHYLKDLRIGKCHQYKLIPFLRSSASNYSNDIFPANIILLCDLCVCHTS